MVINLNNKANITHKGAILLGKYVACDAFDAFRPLRIVTHAHADHLVGLRKSLRTCKYVMMTQATKDLINVINPSINLSRDTIKTFDYNQTFRYKEEDITFFPTDHILGAAQVLVEDDENTRIVYTGDFRIDDTPVLDSDILVMEATYGRPNCRRSFHKDIKNALITLVKQGLKIGTVYIFSYHGKIQEVMQILHKAGINLPFVVPQKVFRISKVCKQYGMHLGTLLSSESEEGSEMLKSNYPCIAFYNSSSRKKIGQNGFRIFVSGWEFNSPYRKVADKEYVIALSDHSDFDGLLEYVKYSKPKLVITDNFRVFNAETLAYEINRRLNIPAIALPKK
jgi:putative mRNA 3-end processing factor